MEHRLPEISVHPTMVNTEQVSRCCNHIVYIQLSILGLFVGFFFFFHLIASYNVTHGAPVMWRCVKGRGSDARVHFPGLLIPQRVVKGCC